MDIVLTDGLRRRPRDIVVVDHRHGGSKYGHCTICRAYGLLVGYGHPSMEKNIPSGHLRHNPGCEMDGHLNPDGSLKE